MSQATIWLLAGKRLGDNNQLVALARATGLPFAIKDLRYNLLQHASGMIGASVASLTSDSRAQLRPPWPDIVIGIARRDVPVALWIRKQSGGRTRIVELGNPRRDPALFDLIISNRQFAKPLGGNTLVLPLALTPYADPPQPKPEERRFLETLPRPIRLVAIGGWTSNWTLEAGPVEQALTSIRSGSAVAVTSHRTEAPMIARLQELAAGDSRIHLVDGPSPRFAVLLHAADEVYVTGDSISMMSEAVLAGKPTAIIPVAMDRRLSSRLGEQVGDYSADPHLRDLRPFWKHLIDQGMAGTVDSGARRAGTLPDPNGEAAAAVLRLLDKSSS